MWLVSQFECAYVRDDEGVVVMTWWAPPGHLFTPEVLPLDTGEHSFASLKEHLRSNLISLFDD